MPKLFTDSLQGAIDASKLTIPRRTVKGKRIGANLSDIKNVELPDGTMFKCLDVSKAKELGWEPYIDLKEGLESSYKWALQNIFN